MRWDLPWERTNKKYLYLPNACTGLFLSAPIAPSASLTHNEATMKAICVTPERKQEMRDIPKPDDHRQDMSSSKWIHRRSITATRRSWRDLTWWAVYWRASNSPYGARLARAPLSPPAPVSRPKALAKPWRFTDPYPEARTPSGFGANERRFPLRPASSSPNTCRRGIIAAHSSMFSRLTHFSMKSPRIITRASS